MSSINLYLSNEVRKLFGFKIERCPDNSDDKITLNGINVSNDKGRLYLWWNEDTPVPNELKDLVEEVSCYETIPQMSHREAGIYRCASAECELIPEDQGNAKRENKVYKLKITAKNLEDIKAIIHKVKTGTIRPEESYEGPQSGKTRQELEAELTTAQETAKSLDAELSATKETFELVKANLSKTQEHITKISSRASDMNCKINAIRQLADDLRPYGYYGRRFHWPWCNKIKIAKRIQTILNNDSRILK